MDEHEYLYSGFRKLPVELERVMNGITDEDGELREGGWNLRQTLYHMLDVASRIDQPQLEQIVEEENPYFPDLGEDKTSTYFTPPYSIETMVESLDDLCADTAVWLEDLGEDEWQRPGTHAILGVHSLAWWADRMLAHLEEHVAYLRGD